MEATASKIAREFGRTWWDCQANMEILEQDPRKVLENLIKQACAKFETERESEMRSLLEDIHLMVDGGGRRLIRLACTPNSWVTFPVGKLADDPGARETFHRIQNRLFDLAPHVMREKSKGR